MISLVCGIFKNIKNESIYSRFTGIENKLIITKRKKKGRDKLGVWNEQIHTTIYKI